jgi:hypothetical protein
VDKRTYSSDDVQAILGRALERQRVGGEGGLSHDELLAIGRDVGLSAEAIEAAAGEHEREGAVDAEVERRLRKKRRGFYGHAATFVLVNAFLFALNAVTGGGFWAFWPLFGWGFGLAMHLLSAALPNRERARERARAALERRRRDDERRREKTARRDQKERERAEREARRQALEQNAQRIKRAVEERLSEAVADLADRLEGAEPPRSAGRARVASDEPGRARVASDEPGRARVAPAARRPADRDADEDAAEDEAADEARRARR